MLKTFSSHKVKAPFRYSWEITNVFFSCNPFIFLYHLGQNRDPSLIPLWNLGLHLLLHLWPLWRLPSHYLLLSWHLKKLFFLLPPQSDDPFYERRFKVSLHSSVAMLFNIFNTFSLKLAVYENCFNIFQGFSNNFSHLKCTKRNVVLFTLWY